MQTASPATLARRPESWPARSRRGSSLTIQDSPWTRSAARRACLSARYAGEPTDDQANNRKLLEVAADLADNRRGAAFQCVLALADPGGTIRLEAAGACRGRLTHEPRGPGGFGYDPLFLIPEYHKTFGELSPLVKHQLSHRARAFASLRPALIRMIAQGDFDRASQYVVSLRV